MSLNVLVWQIHGSYLNTLVQTPHRFYLPTKPDKPEGYGGRGASHVCSPDTVEVPAEEVRDLDLDLVVYQTEKNLFEDAREILTPEQRALPAIYLEHNTPQARINQMVHPVNDPGVLLVHVTHFNDLFWDCRETPTHVIDHAVMPATPEGAYTGELEKGVSNLDARAQQLPVRISELQQSLSTLRVLTQALAATLRQAQRVLSYSALKTLSAGRIADLLRYRPAPRKDPRSG